jgi:PAS domain S-box-containing protein
MLDSLEQLLSAEFMPHGHCYLWTPTMVWTQVVTNTLIGVAYASIAATLTVLVRRIHDIPFRWVYVAFGVFILSCGLTHWSDVVTIWRPLYWADAGLRALTALASVVTALLILPLVPKAVALAETARLSELRKHKLSDALDQLSRAHAALGEAEEDARRRAETSEEQLRAIVESMPQLTYLARPDGTVQHRNARWSEFTGLSREELDGAGFLVAVEPSSAGALHTRWAEALANGTPFEAECQLRGRDGALRWFLARALPVLGKHGELSAWVGTCTDIDAQRRLREEALHTARIKDEFVATVSHELRTPLNAILGWSRLVRSGELSPERGARALETIERNALVQAQLVDDLLDVSRIVSGKLKLELAPVAPVQVVEAALEVVRPAASGRRVTLHAELAADAGFVRADGARLQQVVWNLLDNAVKFTPKDGHVHVRLAREGSAVKLSVSDDGAGIAPEFLPHVFERFSQADGSTVRSHGGLGLGLAIVKHLVELHGGAIHAESRGLGLGATFTVLLPLPAIAPSPLAPGDGQPGALAPFAASASLAGLRVLVVEDDADSRALLAELLTGAGAEVLTAAAAEPALELLAREHVDVLLSDIGLPVTDGYTLMRRVRADRAHATLPAAAITAYAGVEDRKRALEAGFQMHLAKPVEPAELVALVADLSRLRTR